MWQFRDQVCKGEFIRLICYLSVDDLKAVWQSECLIANKFSIRVDPMAILCHLEHIANKNP